MRIDIVTLFPNMIEGMLTESIIKRAIQNGLVEINVVNLRDFTIDKHNKVDDTPFGGGAGMVLTPQPVFDCVEHLKKENTRILLTSPQGRTLTQKVSEEYSKLEHMVILCGHYEGFDERIFTLVDEEISIGDYVLTGGELAAMVITDSVVRLLDGVIKAESHENDSFSSGLLEHPHYTKPREFRGMEVPDILLSGHHKNIEEWRHKESFIRTFKKRPDLLVNRELSKKEKEWLEELKNEQTRTSN